MPSALLLAQGFVPPTFNISTVITPTRICQLSHSVRAISATLVAVAIATNPLRAAALDENLRDGLLRACDPPRFSCIVSQHDIPPSFVEPFEYDPATTTPRQALEAVRDAALFEKGAKLVEQTAQYLRFEFQTAGGPIDAAEFYFPPDDALVHFRAERSHHAFDYASNRARIRRIGMRARLTRLYVQRNRERAFGLFESPFDRFGPSAIDVDSIIEKAPISSRPIR